MTAAPAPLWRRRPALCLFVAALLLRWAYVAAVYAWMGEDGLLGPDSRGFVVWGAAFADRLIAGDVADWAWLSPDLSLMPVFPHAYALAHIVFGPHAPLGFVAAQGVVDAGTCVLIFTIARRLKPDAALWAGVAAATGPTLVVVAGLVYTDTLFVFFTTLGFYATLRWLDAPDWRRAALIGLAFGLALATRAVIAPFAAPLLAFVVAAGWAFHRDLRGSCAHALLIAALAAAAAAPVVGRNVDRYDAWALTPQGGAHLVYWVAPLVREASDGTAPSETVDALRAEFDARASSAPADGRDPFAHSAALSAFGAEKLAEYGVGAVAAAWARGAALNLGAPAAAIAPPIAALPRPGFFATPGDGFADKVWSALFRSGQPPCAWAMTVGAAGVAVATILQVFGLAGAFRLDWRRRAFIGLLAAWCAYILIVSGPVASPKYRLPMEPALAVFAGMGLAALIDRRRSWLERRRRAA